MEVLGLSESTPKPTSRLKDLFWPDLRTMPSTESACRGAAIACFVIAGLTSIVALFTAPTALVDAGLFLVIGLGLLKRSRTAAVAGLALYILEQIVSLVQVGRFPGVITVLISAILLSGVRASFAYHRMRKANVESEPPPVPVA